MTFVHSTFLWLTFDEVWGSSHEVGQGQHALRRAHEHSLNLIALQQLRVCLSVCVCLRVEACNIAN